MARSTKKQNDETAEAQVSNETPETFEEEEFLLPGEKPFVPNQTENESEENDVTEMLEAETANETANSEVPTDSLNLTDEAQRILKDAQTASLPMLDIDSVPEDAVHIKFSLMGVDAFGKKLKERVTAFEVATSGKDEKIAYAIENLPTGSDNYELREKILANKKLLAELEAQILEDDKALYENVEADLAAKGDVIWTDEQIEAESKEITEQWNAYKKIYDGARDGIAAHNAHTAGEKVGNVEQYVSFHEKPFGRKSSSGTSGGSRSPHVSSADYSFDGGQTWNRATNGKEGDAMASNPHFLAAELARKSKDSANTIRENIFSAWYAQSGQTPDNLDTSKVADVSTFTITLPMKPDGELKTVNIRIAKRGTEVAI